MASAYWDEGNEQWVADFRPLGGLNKQRRRVRLDRAKFQAQDAALAFANECERYCRMLEVAPQDPRDVEHAGHIGAITKDQLQRLREGLDAGPAAEDRSRPWTMRDAAEAHPASKRDLVARPRDHALYLDHVDAFCAFAGVTEAGLVTLDQVMRWIVQLTKDGKTWEGRRHRLLYVRRACVMAATRGLPNPLGEMTLDRRAKERRGIAAWTLPELALAVQALDDPRAVAAVALSGMLGLRPSEVARLQIADLLPNGLLSVGARESKNDPSARVLPLPPTIARWCAEAADIREKDKRRAATRPLIPSSNGREMAPSTFNHWLKPLLEDATGRALEVKALRKAFASWAPRAGIPGRDIERFLGHATALLAPVTSRHYLAEGLAEELAPSALLLERAIREAMAAAKPQRKSAQTRVRAALLTRRAAKAAYKRALKAPRLHDLSTTA